MVLKDIKLVICRKDLPENPKWFEEGYPYENCWDVYEFFEEAVKAGKGSKLYHEARRIFWEAYWRRLGRYKKGRPFFEVYEVVGTTPRRVEDKEDWVLGNIIVSAMESGIVPPEVREQTYKVYRKIFKVPVAD